LVIGGYRKLVGTSFDALGTILDLRNWGNTGKERKRRFEPSLKRKLDAANTFENAIPTT